MDEQYQAGERVGIMDEADYRHWSRFGAVIGRVSDPMGGSVPADMYSVQEDGRPAPIPVPANKLVRLAPPEADGTPSEWLVQCFPVDGEQPGLPMHFKTGPDVLDFVRRFFGAGLTDEKLHIRLPASAGADERQTLKMINGVVLV